MPKQAGLTLIELLVALLIMALMSTMVWQGMDTLFRSRGQLQSIQNEQSLWQGTLGQWETDWLETVAAGLPNPVRFDGNTLVLVRRAWTQPAPPFAEGWRVVAWRLGGANAQASAVQRWASAPCETVVCLELALSRAQRWAQAQVLEAIDEHNDLAVVRESRLYFATGPVWANPLSSTGQTTAITTAQPVPQGVRWVLTPERHGPLVKDWINPAAMLPKAL